MHANEWKKTRVLPYNGPGRLRYNGAAHWDSLLSHSTTYKVTVKLPQR